MSRSQQNFPDWLLERFALGELPAARAAEIEQALAHDQELAARLATLEASTHEILATYPAATEVRAIRARAGAEQVDPQATRRWRWGLSGLVLAMPAAAALVLVVVMQPPQGDKSPAGFIQAPGAISSDVRIKGDAHLVVRRKAGTQAERLDAGAPARAGDLLQVAYVAGGKRYGAILSVDGRGAVTLHFPTAPFVDTLLSQEGEVLLPTAYELDNAPGFERFVFVTADTPMDLDLVMRQADLVAREGAHAATRSLSLPAHYHQSSFLLTKVER